MKNINILYEDEHILAVDKPSGLLSIPGRQGTEPSVLNYLKTQYDTVLLVHRLDRDTSGLMILAKDALTQKEVSQRFEHHEVDKTYIALISGHLTVKQGTIDNFIQENPNQKGTYRIAYKNKGKRAISHYKVVDEYKKASLVEFQIETGRTHQIRVHAAFLGTPLLYDPIYNPNKFLYVSDMKPKYKVNERKEERPIIQRLTLHASRVVMPLSYMKKPFDVMAPLPSDFKKAIKILEKYSQ